MIKAVLAAAAVAVCVAATQAGATTIYPILGPSTEGGSDNVIPTFRGDMIYQQVFDARLFAPGAVTLSALRLRFDSTRIPPDAAFSASDVQISFSTTSASVDALSTVFANNRGADQTLVRSGPLSIVNPTSPVSGPRAFDIVLSFATNFVYDPSAGNLLLEWVHTGATGSAILDAPTTKTSDGTSRVTQNRLGSNAFSDSAGLVVAFDTVVIPLPAALPLMLAGLGALGFVARRRRG